MKILLVLVALLPSVAVAQVYKCEVAGKTVYSQRPCAVDVEEMKLRPHGGTAGGPDSGLRESERQMLEAIDADRAAAAEAEAERQASAPPSRGFSCNGVLVSRWTPFDITENIGGLIQNTRCAKVSAALPGYANRLFDTHVGREIAGRFTAKFDDGGTRGARNTPSLSGRQSIELSGSYTFNVCFGVNKFEIERLWCQ